MQLLYDYLISREFAEQWQAIREGFMSMKLSIQKERDAMEKLWKSREKQLEKVLLNAAHIRGSMKEFLARMSISIYWRIVQTARKIKAQSKSTLTVQWIDNLCAIEIPLG